MKNNLRDAVLKIGQFLGDEFVVKLKENSELLFNKVIENSTVDSMKSFLGERFKYKIRKGIVGD
jgi:GGDEF domain-containing protein